MNKPGAFYYESDSLALRGNSDYIALVKVITSLQAQQIQAVKDLEKLMTLKKEALKDPLVFVDKLQNGFKLDVSEIQPIPEVPSIYWSKYNVSSPASFSGPNTRNIFKRPFNTTPIEIDIKPDLKKEEKQNIKIRGRMYTDNKPETFNQLWTAEEQQRLEELLVEYPYERIVLHRYAKIAKALGNRTAIQVQSRVQKYFIKLQKAGLPVPGRPINLQAYHSLRTKRVHKNMARRPSTFFHENAPVSMPFDDEFSFRDTSPSCSNNQDQTDEQQIDEKEPEEEPVSDEDVPDNLKSSLEYRQLQILKAVKKEKEREAKGEAIIKEHLGFSCDACSEDPIIGTRWHCFDCDQCGQGQSVDFCSNCVVELHHSPPHLNTHRIEPVRNPTQSDWNYYFNVS